MFSRRLEKAYCCIPVRTGALVTAAIITLFSIVRVFAAFYKAKEWTLILGTDLTQFSRLEGLLEENWVENSIGKLVMDLVLIFGLVERKHLPCLAWLIYSGFFGIVTIIKFIGTGAMLIYQGSYYRIFITASEITATSLVGISLVLGSCVVTPIWLHMLKVVQSEWMNIKDLEATNKKRKTGNPPTYFSLA